MAGFFLVLLRVILSIQGCGGVAERGLSLEREGVVKYDDCRQTITLDAATYDRSPRLYTCDTRRTGSGKLMEATCAHVELADSGACNVAYVHHKRTAVICPEATPYLWFDDKCYADYEIGRVYAGKPR